MKNYLLAVMGIIILTSIVGIAQQGNGPQGTIPSTTYTTPSNIGPVQVGVAGQFAYYPHNGTQIGSNSHLLYNKMVGGSPSVVDILMSDGTPWSRTIEDLAAPAGSYIAEYMGTDGGYSLQTLPSGVNSGSITMPGTGGVILQGTTGSFTLTNALASLNIPMKATAYQSATNCSSVATPAVCGSAAAGSVLIPTGTTSSTLTVNTTAVTANSQIIFYPDDSLGTKLGVTCNSTLATLVGGSFISARTGGTSFQITFNGTIAVNGVCGSYFIVN